MTTQKEMLPPEIENHPDLDVDCPHCKEELSIAINEVYKILTYWTSAKRDIQQRANLISGHWIRVTCPGCDVEFDVGLNATISVKYSAISAISDPSERVIGQKIMTPRSTIPTVKTITL